MVSRNNSSLRGAVLLSLALSVGFFIPSNQAFAQEAVLQEGLAQEEVLPAYLSDRGTGVSLSMFGTYINKGELIVYPFFEYFIDRNFEYEPFELGFGLEQEFRGIFRADEELIFIGYGLTDNLAFEFEASMMSATFTRSELDTVTDQTIKESGIGDIEGQIRWRWRNEDEGRPEIFNYFEFVGPTAGKHVLIGSEGWEFKQGIGFIKGYSWGTMTYRVAGEYDQAENKYELGEYAVEYLKRWSPGFRTYAGIEGSQDEIELITELQFHINDNMFFKFNNAFGVTSKATDWAPEVGIVFVIPTGSR